MFSLGAIFDPDPDPKLDSLKLIYLRERGDESGEVDIVAVNRRGAVLYTIATFTARGVVPSPKSAVSWKKWYARQQSRRAAKKQRVQPRGSRRLARAGR